MRKVHMMFKNHNTTQTKNNYGESKARKLRRSHKVRLVRNSMAERSPLNTNQFLIDRFEVDSKGLNPLSYGSISDELSLARIEEELQFLHSQRDPIHLKENLVLRGRSESFDTAQPKQKLSLIKSASFEQGMIIEQLLSKMADQDRRISELQERVRALELESTSSHLSPSQYLFGDAMMSYRDPEE